ncbi:MAG TPA: hypothetical protein VMT32_08160 [Bryobacteraceae bacterium]|nr:hypothetical protein [Bryobacteraceae bacterium]
MLLLRAAVGIAVLIQGGFYLADSANLATGTWIAGLLGVGAGVALLIGFLTPIAAVLVGLGATGTWLSFLPPSTPNLFDAKLSVIFAMIITAALAFLGPGAYSLDARLFGRREIIIPPVSRSPR